MLLGLLLLGLLWEIPIEGSFCCKSDFCQVRVKSSGYSSCYAVFLQVGQRSGPYVFCTLCFEPFHAFSSQTNLISLLEENKRKNAEKKLILAFHSTIFRNGSLHFILSVSDVLQLNFLNNDNCN